jgi:pimeloyl-ACP methyl ester carboxylesterase
VDELRLDHGDVSLSAVDFGGRGPPVILLHGLAGYAGEWTESASWLRERHRVVALDQRGHGASERLPPTVVPGAFVEDVVTWLDALGLERASVVGQSFGGLIAFLAAARHPGRITRLVVAEASPSPDAGAEAEMREWLESWPVPFPDEEAAMVARLHDAALETVLGAGHDVHLEQPANGAASCSLFLDAGTYVPPTGAGARNPGS